VLDLSPAALAERQLAGDRHRTKRFDGIFERKVERMRVSPLAFLRGSAPLFYEILAAKPELARGPGGVGWIAGDLHLENFGAYRADEHSFEKGHKAGERVVFDLNDFDEAMVAPWRYDVLRLVTSVILGGRAAGQDGMGAIALARSLIDAYVATACEGARAAAAPRAVLALVEQVRSRTRLQLLDARTIATHGRRAFRRGPRYRDLAPAIVNGATKAFADYIEALPESARPLPKQAEIVDLALRIAGTGSLGCLRVAILVTGKGGVDGGWIFDMKEEDAPALGALVRAPSRGKAAPADRVIAGMSACLGHPPQMAASTRLRGASMLVRRLAPQEDKLAFQRLPPAELAAIAAYLGSCAGAAHARGATQPPKKPWTNDERARVLESAIELAGLHEAAYLAFCHRIGAVRP
jgi:uncharacterized protein (DUF2252 family)